MLVNRGASFKMSRQTEPLSAPSAMRTAVATLALGMCASVAIFAFVDAALIKPLPYRNPGRLVGVFESAPPVSAKQSFLS